mgnify:CR=1 FL=1
MAACFGRSDKQSVLTHNGLEESVVRGDFRFEERHIRRFQPTFTLVAAHGRGHARQQFRSRFARESQSEDFFGLTPCSISVMIRLVIV